MGDKQNSEKSKYIKWSTSVTRFSKIFIAGTCILICLLIAGIKVLDMTSALFWASIIAILLWCGYGYLYLHKKMKEKESLRESAHNVDRPEITNPLFKELFDEYELNELEEFTQNIFFHTWKLTSVDDFNNVITLCFCKKLHEIIIDLSETEISIIIDEETDAPTELVLNMQDFNSLEEVFNTITAVCRESISKLDKQK